MKRFTFLTPLFAICLLSSAALAADWGDLTVAFKYDGAVPSSTPIVVTKDPAYCGIFGLVDESLVVNKENGGIANVIVYLYLARGQKQPPVHASYEELIGEEVKVDNNKCRFAPRVQQLWTKQKLIVLNSDNVGHNTNFATLMSNPQQNLLVPAKGQFEMSLTAEERLPAKISCNIHPWMTGWVVIRDNPYMGVSDENGKVTIKNLPVGDWTFQFYHEKSGYVSEAKQKGKAVKIRRGRMEVSVKSGSNDLGEYQVPASLFKK
jgi:hypothetical protein